MKKLLINLILIFSLLVMTSFSNASSDYYTEAKIPVKIINPKDANIKVEIDLESLNDEYKLKESKFIFNGGEIEKIIKIPFTKPGTYKFSMKQNVSKNGGLSIDTSNFDITVFVENERDSQMQLTGKMINSVIIQGENESNKKLEALFENKKITKPTPKPVNENPIKPGNPLTGDNFNLPLYIVLFIISTILLIFFVFRKKESENEK